jgi:hypothetical protein
VQFKLAILTVLATRPDGRATLDELKGEVEALTADADQHEDSSSALDDIDIFQSGLVIPEGSQLRITEAGRSALKAIEGQGAPSLDLPPTSTSQSLEMIDDLIGTEERLKIFDLELREEVDPNPEGAEARDAASTEALPVADQDTDPELLPESIAQTTAPETSDFDSGSSATIATLPAEPPAADAPAFLARDGFSSGVKAPKGAPPWRGRLFKLIAARLQAARVVWRRHLERDPPNLRGGKRTGNVTGGAIALLTLLVLVICAGAVIALTQIRSLKSEVATLQRELSPLRERAAKADLLEKAKQNADQQKESQNKSGAEKNKAGADPRTEQAALNLTSEEIRLIRDFIKPAPFAGTPAPAINVGDTVSIATIPLPSPLMEKIPKLLGARFTTRNGSIIILRRDSRQADAVLPPN